jgi:hypothetical protein
VILLAGQFQLTLAQKKEKRAVVPEKITIPDTLDMEAGYQPELVNKDSIVYPFFSSAAVLYDYGKLIGLALDTESKYELGVQFEFKNRLIFIGEFGMATLEPNGAYQNGSYISKGNYFRVGLGWKIDMNPKNNFYFSLRYASASFEDSGEINITSTSGLYDRYVEVFRRNDLAATWYEFVLSSEMKAWKGLYLGFHFRLRIMDKYDLQSPLDVYSIPGYGRTFDATIPALNLYVKYAFDQF